MVAQKLFEELWVAVVGVKRAPAVNLQDVALQAQPVRQHADSAKLVRQAGVLLNFADIPFQQQRSSEQS